MAVEANTTPPPVSQASMNDAGLLPCPFCDCDTSEVQWANYAYWVVCSSCEAHGPKADPTDFLRNTAKGRDHAARDTAVEGWNARSKAVTS